MFIPRYWSEASRSEPLEGRSRMTVHRFGWSSTSQEDADVHARQRLEEALAVLRQGGPDALRGFTRRERRVAYSGSDGLPIREEIVRENEPLQFVITRNSYGSLCMNTTEAMFVDVDTPESRVGCFGCVGIPFGAVAGGIGGLYLTDVTWIWPVLGGALLFWFLGKTLATIIDGLDPQRRDPVRASIKRVNQWCEEHRDWRVAVYETPAGARLLPLHATFDAGEESTFEFMNFVGADPLYQRMCRLQKCFRARVSPKPWRAGITDHFKTGGTWPVHDPQKLAVRAEWVARYELAADRYGSCRLVEILGRGRVDSRVESIRREHDEMCRADVPIALA